MYVTKSMNKVEYTNNQNKPQTKENKLNQMINTVRNYQKEKYGYADPLW